MKCPKEVNFVATSCPVHGYQSTKKENVSQKSEQKRVPPYEDIVSSSAAPEASWKSFAVTVVKEARNYDKGIRRMTRSFEDATVLSSNVDDRDSSDEEEEPNIIDVNKDLHDIPFLRMARDNIESKNNSSGDDKKNGEAVNPSKLSFSEKKSLKRFKISVLRKSDRECSGSDLSTPHTKKLKSDKIQNKKEAAAPDKIVKKLKLLTKESKNPSPKKRSIVIYLTLNLKK
ncbi:uncharacterized protein LOC117169763 [Belonocnema kinseyi]|uniref:uncharacterized protein LOC117169763 n=1 Tax=Belonocnema kinseyi TaxID=2817044 RepID=UPI00143D1BFC|nr:uncharacterized protein LOC117169763 [Belonocnema kinseyi]